MMKQKIFSAVMLVAIAFMASMVLTGRMRDANDAGALLGMTTAQRKSGNLQAAEKALSKLEKIDPGFAGVTLERVLGTCPTAAAIFANGTSTSLWRITTRPTSPAKSRMRSSAGLVRLAVSPGILALTNSLWMLNSPMPVNTPGNVVKTRRM